MGRIEISVGAEEIVYRLVGQGHTGEIFDELPAAGVPETVAYNLGLLPTRYGPTGEAEAYTRYVIGKDEERVSVPKPKPEGNGDGGGGLLPRFTPTTAGRVAEGFDWKLDVLPHAVKECRLELRADYIEQKVPATTKAAYREREHTQATMLIERGERGRKPFPSSVRRI